MGKYTFRKEERLRKEKLIQELFEKGISISLYPFKVLYQPNPTESDYHQALFTAPSRQFKKAADRNKIKRRTREAYRIKKSSLLESPKLLLGFIYIAKKIEEYPLIEKAVEKAIQKLNATFLQNK